MNDGISKREFGCREECNEALVRRAVNQGKLVAYGDGTISAALVDTAWRKSNVLSLPGRPEGADKGADTRTQVYAPADVRTDPGAESSAIEQHASELLAAGVVTLLPRGGS